MRAICSLSVSAFLVLTAASCDRPNPDEPVFATVQLDLAGTCPDPFGLTTSPADVDRNGDGYACLRKMCTGNQPGTKCTWHFIWIDNNKPIKGDCLQGHESVSAEEEPLADQNEDEVICRKTTEDESRTYSDNSY